MRERTTYTYIHTYILSACTYILSAYIYVYIYAYCLLVVHKYAKASAPGMLLVYLIYLILPYLSVCLSIYTIVNNWVVRRGMCMQGFLLKYGISFLLSFSSAQGLDDKKQKQFISTGFHQPWHYYYYLCAMINPSYRPLGKTRLSVVCTYVVPLRFSSLHVQ